jgi:hypothetical protein
MEFELAIGKKVIKAKLPLFGDRFRLINAWQNALQNESNVEDFAAVSYAAIGLVWDEEKPLDCPNLRSCNRDLIEFGEVVFDALFRLGFHDVAELFNAGQLVRQAIYDSIPTIEEVEEAADPFEGPEASSIGIMSN